MYDTIRYYDPILHMYTGTVPVDTLSVGTHSVGAPPVDAIIGAAVGAIFVVLIIIITVVSIVLMRSKIGKS